MDTEKIEKALKNAKATIEVEGNTISIEQEELVRRKLKGEITEEKFLEDALKLAQRK